MARSRKRQTQLLFTPLSTSSPQTPEPPHDAKGRLVQAKHSTGCVKDTSSPARKPKQTRIVTETSIPESGQQIEDIHGSTGMLTPTQSSLLEGAEKVFDTIEDLSSSDGVRVRERNQRKQHFTKQKLRQTNARSFFSQSISPPDKALPLQQSPSRQRISSSSSLFNTARKPLYKQEKDRFRLSHFETAINRELKQGNRDFVVNPRKDTKKRQKIIGEPSIQNVDGSLSRQMEGSKIENNHVSDNYEDSEDSLIFKEPPKKTISATNGDAYTNEGPNWSQQSSAASEQVSTRSDRILRSHRKDSFPAPISPVETPKATPRQRGDTFRVVGTSSSIEVSSDIGTEDSGEDFGPLQVTLKRSVNKKRPSNANTTSFVVNDDDDNMAELSDTIEPPVKAKTHCRAQQVSDTDSDVIVSPPKRRRLLSSHQNSPRSSRKKLREKEELEEDLAFLKASDSEDQRSLVAKKPSIRETRKLNLEKMKARREKKAGFIPLSEEPEIEHDGNSEGSDVIQGYQLVDRNLDEYDDDFVVEGEADDNANMADIPIQFTQHAHASAKVHFKHVIEWMVHNKINPAFSRNDVLYRMAFEKVDREAKAYSNSKLMSSTWKPEFNRALRARPIFSEVELVSPADIVKPHCAACNRTSHPASFKVTLSGKPYDPDTLENLRDCDEEEDDDDTRSSSVSGISNADSVDIHGHVLPSAEHEFYLGSFCKANSARAHALLHWKWHLNDWVIDWLSQKGYTNPQYIIERDNWSYRRRQKFANKVVDEMEEEEIKNLWRDFKNQISEAREQKVQVMVELKQNSKRVQENTKLSCNRPSRVQ